MTTRATRRIGFAGGRRPRLGRIAVAACAASLLAACGEPPEDAAAERGARPLGPALLSPAELDSALDASPGVLVLDARPSAEHAAGHLPGAVSAPVDDLAPAILGGLDEESRALVGARLAALGVGRARGVVVVDAGARDGFARAAHGCWLVSLAGAAPCQVLEGGVAAWREAGLALETGAVEASGDGSLEIDTRPATLADMELVRAAVFDGRSALVDVQAGGAAPSIPGAWRVPLDELVDDRGRADRERLARAVSEARLELEDETIVFGEGPRDGAAGWFLLGPASEIDGVRLYPGGMRHWSLTPHLPRTDTDSDGTPAVAPD